MNDISYLIDKVYRYLAIRIRSKYEVETYLNRKIDKYEPKKQEIISNIITILENQGYIDDTKFAEVFANSRINKHKGKILIEQELLQKGIDKGTILTVLSKLDEDEIIKQCIEIAGKKLPLIKAKTHFETIAKLKKYLFQKGYDSNQINTAIDFITQTK